MPSGRSMRCRCPKCRHDITVVVQASDQDDGRIVRRRKCAECDHRWFTVQEPEYLAPKSVIGYRYGRLVVRD
jgi:transcriptional regulator NrdR family protein